MEIVSVRMPETFVDDVDEYAKNQEITRSQAIREGVRRHIMKDAKR